MSTYIFNGKIIPQYAIPPDFFLSTSAEIEAVGNTLCFDAIISIRGSQVSVIAKNVSKNSDLPSLRNYVRQYARSVVDVLNYTWGQGYDIEITSAVDLNGELVAFDAGVLEIWKTQAERPLKIEQLYKLAFKSEHLRRAFGDLREAIRLSEDTSFFCYRAIESIRQYFWEEKDGEHTKRSWERLQKALYIDRNWIDALKPFADKQRHGLMPYTSEADRVLAMQHAWKVVDRFCVYLYKGSVPLSEGEFDKLKES